MMPRAGDVVLVGRAASVQFAAPILFRVIRVHDWETYSDWAWLDGYELNNEGDAVARRSIFVQPAGLRAVGTAPDPRARNGRRPGSAATTSLSATAAPVAGTLRNDAQGVTTCRT